MKNVLSILEQMTKGSALFPILPWDFDRFGPKEGLGVIFLRLFFFQLAMIKAVHYFCQYSHIKTALISDMKLLQL